MRQYKREPKIWDNATHPFLSLRLACSFHQPARRAFYDSALLIMIAGLSKAATLYLAPVLTLTAIILSLLVYLAPVLLLHDKVALLTVTPSTALFQNASSHAIDGPSVFLGVLGNTSAPFRPPCFLTCFSRLMLPPEKRCRCRLHDPNAEPHLWCVIIQFAHICSF